MQVYLLVKKITLSEVYLYSPKEFKSSKPHEFMKCDIFQPPLYTNKHICTYEINTCVIKENFIKKLVTVSNKMLLVCNVHVQYTVRIYKE